MPQKFIAKSRLQPGEVLLLGGPSRGLLFFMALPAQVPPGFLTITELDASAHKLSPFSGQSQVLASLGGRSFAERTCSLIHHGSALRELSVSRERPNSSSKSVTKL
jgi:hypothetical protein